MDFGSCFKDLSLEHLGALTRRTTLIRNHLNHFDGLLAAMRPSCTLHASVSGTHHPALKGHAAAGGCFASSLRSSPARCATSGRWPWPARRGLLGPSAPPVLSSRPTAVSQPAHMLRAAHGSLLAGVSTPRGRAGAVPGAALRPPRDVKSAAKRRWALMRMHACRCTRWHCAMPFTS